MGRGGHLEMGLRGSLCIGISNTGLNYIQDKFDNAKEEFRSPYVFINLLREVVESKQKTD